MPYINIDPGFPEHRKTKRLVSTLGRGSESLLIRLWCYVARHHAESGRLSDYSPEEIESLAGWVGRPGRMLDAFQRLGWMEKDDDGWFIVNWMEHQGHIAAFKARGKAMAEARWQRVRDATSNAASIAVSNAPTEPTDPSEVQAERETARRPSLEDVKTRCQMSGCPESEGEAFWHHFESSGWIDKNGHRVLKWESKLATWVVNARAKPAEETHHAGIGGRNGASTVTFSKELDRVMERMKSIKATYGDCQSWAKEDVEEFNKLKARRTELRKILGVKV